MTVGNQKAFQTLLTSWAQNCGDPWNKVSFQKITKQKKPILQTFFSSLSPAKLKPILQAFFSSLSPCSKAHSLIMSDMQYSSCWTLLVQMLEYVQKVISTVVQSFDF